MKLDKILIIGATSAIAYETAKLFAANKAQLYLVGRSPEKLAAVQADLLTRGAKRAEIFLLDVNELDRHQELVDSAIQAFGSLDAVLIAHGTLSDQVVSQKSVALTIREFTTNCVSVISLLTILVNYFEEQKRGCI